MFVFPPVFPYFLCILPGFLHAQFRSQQALGFATATLLIVPVLVAGAFEELGIGIPKLLRLGGSPLEALKVSPRGSYGSRVSPQGLGLPGSGKQELRATQHKGVDYVSFFERSNGTVPTARFHI